MATNNAVNVGLSGSTGTGSFVGSTSPTLVTPTLGVATGTSMAFSPTTGGIVGTTAADNAAAGRVGEFISSVILNGSAVSLVTATAKNVTSISLTAGDWDVWGNLQFAISSVSTNVSGGINTTTNTLPDASLYSLTSSTSIAGAGFCVPQQRINISTTTTIFIVAFSVFAAGTVSAYGGIYARRVR